MMPLAYCPPASCGLGLPSPKESPQTPHLPSFCWYCTANHNCKAHLQSLIVTFHWWKLINTRLIKLIKLIYTQTYPKVFYLYYLTNGSVLGKMFCCFERLSVPSQLFLNDHLVRELQGQNVSPNSTNPFPNPIQIINYNRKINKW